MQIAIRSFREIVGEFTGNSSFIISVIIVGLLLSIFAGQLGTLLFYIVVAITLWAKQWDWKYFGITKPNWPNTIFKAFLFTAIVGGIYAIIILIIRGRFLDTIMRMWLSLKLTVLTRCPTAPDEGSASPVLCYGIAIAIGTSLSMVF